MKKGTLIASIMVLTATIFAEQQTGSGFADFSRFKQAADAASEDSRSFRTREQIKAAREQDLKELDPAKRGKIPAPVELGVDKATLRQKMASLQPKWTVCYQSLPDDAKRSGDVQLAFQITPKGAVQNERVLLESSLGNRTLRECMLKALRAARFPERKVPTTITSYPVTFTPQPAE